jgi:NADH-ubiquinone oxidoreductase chain 5
MAAPTPVSALVHSSTLVTAGVYLLIRHNNLFLRNYRFSLIIIIGRITIIMARLRAIFETDIKKIVALSTLSQLGVMILRLGLGAFTIRFFHLLRHAYFKALLFICAGVIIHRRKDYQDIRVIGRRIIELPIINRFTLISIARLIGLPFMSAFFSKDIVLDLILIDNFYFSSLGIIILGVVLTAAYRTRFIIFIFNRFTHNELITFKLEKDFLVSESLFFLIIPASCGGYIFNTYLWDFSLLTSVRLYFKLIVFSCLFIGIITALTLRVNLYFSSWNEVK